MNEVVVLAAYSGNLVTSLTNLCKRLGGSKRDTVFATKPIVSDRNGIFKTLCIGRSQSVAAALQLMFEHP